MSNANTTAILEKTQSNATATHPLLEAALEYSKRGWPIFPLHSVVSGECTCRKKDCGNSAGKHPRTRNGFKAATTNEPQIRKWWKKWPQANIGVATGLGSGLVVLDVDDKDNGSATLAALENQHGSLPKTLICITGNGRHCYFKHPGGTVKNSSGSIGMGLDVRGDGGLVAAPPSHHWNGSTYRWSDPDEAIAILPDWLLDRMNRTSGHALVLAPPLIPIGQRNDALTRIAGGLRANGMGQDEIEAELVQRNSSVLEHPLPLAEVHAIAKSIAQYSPGRQDDLPWFQFYVNDFLANPVVRFGRDFEVGWYIQLLVEAWRRGGALLDDPEVLWRIAGADSREAFEKNCHLVLSQFEPHQLRNGTPILVHRWLANHHIAQAMKYRQRVEAAAKSVEKRKTMAMDSGSVEGFYDAVQ